MISTPGYCATQEIVMGQLDIRERSDEPKDNDLTTRSDIR